MRQRYLIFLIVLVLFTVGFFTIGSSMITDELNEIKRVDKKIKVAQEKLNSAKIMNEQLSEFTRIIQNSLTKEKKFDSVETNLFVKNLAELADKHKISVVSMLPKDVFSSANLIEQKYTMELSCTYIQMGRFLSQLESLDHIVKINQLEVKPVYDRSKQQVEGQETIYTVTIELSVFKVLKEA
ncbi:MAG: type 4a pilus biogenesis protein PilO [Candidatus Cloacimonetes bacterium]|nr:type 4a pilus biogenesis protein PilO [Candidatus Cloacimonadota bacterium]